MCVPIHHLVAIFILHLKLYFITHAALTLHDVADRTAVGLCPWFDEATASTADWEESDWPHRPGKFALVYCSLVVCVQDVCFLCDYPLIEVVLLSWQAATQFDKGKACSLRFYDWKQEMMFPFFSVENLPTRRVYLKQGCPHFFRLRTTSKMTLVKIICLRKQYSTFSYIYWVYFISYNA